MVRFCKVWLITWVVGAAFFLASREALAASMRSIPDDNLGYPVLITSKSNQGSGFFFNAATATYLVTAKHVLFDPASQHLRDPEVQLVSYPRDPSDTTRNVLDLDLAALEKAGNIRSHPTEDVAVVKIATVDSLPSSSQSPTPASAALLAAFRMTTPLAGVKEIEISQSGMVGVGPATVKTYSQVLTGNDIVLFGYPNSLGLQQLPQLDPQRPLLRKGIIAGTNPSRHLIVLDCPSYQGNSGGPVLEIDHEAFGTKFSIIGLVVQSVPFDDMWINARQGYTNHTLLNSGYSIAEPMDPVLELLK